MTRNIGKTGAGALWLWFAVIAATFFSLDCLSLHTGDDLGYMFADSAHHAGDGERVTGLWQCFTTQNSHYMTTNGRYAVHVVVMIMLNLVPLWLFRALNALMFALLWLGMLRLVAPTRPSQLMCAAVWGALLIFLPLPGMLLFTLVAYAVNYLWTACAVVWLIVWLRRAGTLSRNAAAVLLASCFVTGTLQESFSIPVSMALFVASVMRRLPWKYTVAFIAGTAVVVFAPGNMAHAAQGGGMASAALAHKLTALGRVLTLSVIPLAVCMVNRRNLPWIAAIALSLLFACFTFTSPRQLTCPTVLTLMLLLKWLDKATERIRNRRTIKLTTVAIVAVTGAFMALLAVLRLPVYNRWQSVLHNLDKNTALTWPDREKGVSADGTHKGVEVFPEGYDYVYADPKSVKAALLRAVDPDPLLNRGLVGIGDRYTIRGLDRLRRYEHPDAPALTGILPVAPTILPDIDTLLPYSILHLPVTTRPPRGYLQQLVVGDTRHVIIYAP